MKTIKTLSLTIGLVITALSLFACVGQDNATTGSTPKADRKGFAVLELFTSEGCSSCPPADKLLAKIAEEAQGKAIYLLAYHVDYWDRQGWKDIFSNPDYSKRQARYASWMNTTQVYTPQLVVNGKAEFVGSDESAIRDAITTQLSTPSDATLALRAQQEHAVLQVQYEATGALKESSLLIALVEKAAQSKVTRGENAGRSLSHVQIVQQLQLQPLSKTGKGTLTVALPKDFNNRDWEVLGLIQKNGNGAISGAAKADLDDSTVKQ